MTTTGIAALAAAFTWSAVFQSVLAVSKDWVRRGH
jgi:hypothetical protein